MEPILPGLSTGHAVLLDERERPDFRDVFGALARPSVDIADAVQRVRLSTLDMGSIDRERVESRPPARSCCAACGPCGLPQVIPRGSSLRVEAA